MPPLIPFFSKDFMLVIVIMHTIWNTFYRFCLLKITTMTYICPVKCHCRYRWVWCGGGGECDVWRGPWQMYQLARNIPVSMSNRLWRQWLYMQWWVNSSPSHPSTGPILQPPWAVDTHFEVSIFTPQQNKYQIFIST